METGAEENRKKASRSIEKTESVFYFSWAICTVLGFIYIIWFAGKDYPFWPIHFFGTLVLWCWFLSSLSLMLLSILRKP